MREQLSVDLNRSPRDCGIAYVPIPIDAPVSMSGIGNYGRFSMLNLIAGNVGQA